MTKGWGWKYHRYIKSNSADPGFSGLETNKDQEMRLFVLLFFSGILLLHFFATLPDLKWTLLATAIALVFIIHKNTRILATFAFGFAWSLFYVQTISSWSLPENLEGKTITIYGAIASIPDDSKSMTSFLFSLKKIQSE